MLKRKKAAPSETRSAHKHFSAETTKNKSLSELHQKALSQLEKMSDEQIKAVLAFINSLDEIEKSFLSSHKQEEI